MTWDEVVVADARAFQLQREAVDLAAADQDTLYADEHYDSRMSEPMTNKSILRHFKGCVRCLLD